MLSMPKLRRLATLAVRTVLVTVTVGASPLLFLFIGVGGQSRVVAWACTILGTLGLFLAAGLTIRGRAFGVLVDERNRYSLSRLQMTLWTILVAASIYVVFISNLMLDDEWREALNVDLDLNLMILMGFSLASFTVAPLAVSRKASQATSEQTTKNEAQELQATQRLDALPESRGRLMVKQTPRDARLADLIRGEEVDNATTVDLPRTQLLLITVVVVLAYGGAIAGCLFNGGATRIDALPELSATLLMFILVSHGGYLAGKLMPGSTTSGGSGEQAARALQVSQRTTATATQIQSELLMVPAGDPRRKQLENHLAVAQALAADAAALSTRSSSVGFNAEEIALMEGRAEALQATVRSLLGAAPSAAVDDAPAAETVRKVQRKLAALGHGVIVTGVADAATERAIGVELAKTGVERSNLHPRPYRYYEELAQLI